MDGVFREQPRGMLKSTTNSDFISNALRRIVREHWQTKATTDQKSIQILNDHASRMETLLGSFDYGAICMPNIILNSKKMNQRDLVVYLSYIESLAIGYKLWLGDNDSANIFIAGLTLKARDTRLDSLEMPFGKRTVQRRSVWSTWSTMVASPGGCSATGSMRRKSGPMWVMAMGARLTISRTSTLAEWAP